MANNSFDFALQPDVVGTVINYK